MAEYIVRTFLNQGIRQREDGFWSLTDMCRVNGKILGNWTRLDSTQEYLNALREARYSDPHNALEPIEIIQGGEPTMQGTWGDRQVAIRLAQWISPQFAIQVDAWVVELMSQGFVSIADQPRPKLEPRRLPPVRDVLDYLEAAKSIGIDQDPILKSLFSQRLAEQLGGVPNPDFPQPVVLTVRAGELGFSAKDIGDGSKLGKYVKRRIDPIGKSQHGKYEVNVYDPGEELDATILEFFDRG
jgi:KilA-N domain